MNPPGLIIMFSSLSHWEHENSLLKNMLDTILTPINHFLFFLGPRTGTIALDPTFGSFTLLEPVSTFGEPVVSLVKVFTVYNFTSVWDQRESIRQKVDHGGQIVLWYWQHATNWNWFKLFRLELIFFWGVQSVDTVGRCTTSTSDDLLAGPMCLWCLVLFFRKNSQMGDTKLSTYVKFLVKIILLFLKNNKKENSSPNFSPFWSGCHPQVCVLACCNFNDHCTKVSPS